MAGGYVPYYSKGTHDAIALLWPPAPSFYFGHVTPYPLPNNPLTLPYLTLK